jgi:glutamate carboxypeptidase
VNELRAALEAGLPGYLRELEELCRIECPTSSKDGVDEAGAWVQRWASNRRWVVQTWPGGAVGDSLLVTTGGPVSGPGLLLAAHLDTVYPVGTAAARPPRYYGDRILAPGAADNKSGLLSALHAMAALEDAGMAEALGSVALFCGGDEETDMHVSAAILAELRPSFRAALVLEAGRENGDVVVARKGRGLFNVEVTGKAAHAGVEPHRGANAILACAQQVVAVQLLSGSRPGLTVNVGAISGGTAPNVVPDRASFDIDVRVSTDDDHDFMDAALHDIAGAAPVPGTSSRLSGGWLAPPMPRTAGNEALLKLARGCATDLGFDVGGAETGGISYANHLAAMALSVLDGLAPIGGLDHSPDEYVLVSSIVPRTALLAMMIHRFSQSI